MNRLYSLDYLRGIAALGIMMYHYFGWSYTVSADSFLGRVGIYGVSIFYILSGLTLYYVYESNMIPQKRQLIVFFKKRFFRIFPLLWLTTTISILLSRISPDLYKLLLNLTGLFAVFDWSNYYAIGAWSIGNELVFYLFFPLFMFLSKHYIKSFYVLVAVLLFIYLYFALSILEQGHTIGSQWRSYTNPLNQVFLFLGGFLIGKIFKEIEVKRNINFIVLVIGIFLFVFIPVGLNRIDLVVGLNRILFTLSCFLITFWFFKNLIKIPSIIHKPLVKLGEISYSVYLMHPLVFSFVGGMVALASSYNIEISLNTKLAISVILTVISSYLSYYYFEKYFIKLGSRVTIS